MEKPDWLFDRDKPWRQLTNFVDPARRGADLAIVYGRRRQGKTTLLEALAESTGGFYWQARQQSSIQNLRSFSNEFTQWAGLTIPANFGHWDDALAAVFALDQTKPVVIMIDEFGYLLDTAPEITSIIQAKLTPTASRTGNTRLIVCGSAFSQMRMLSAPDAPLRGRAGLELVVGPFDYRMAAQFWGLESNPLAAFELHSLLGGTPGYRQLARTAPKAGDIDTWAIEHLLEPSSPLHREGRIVVDEDLGPKKRGLYWAVLAAISNGANRSATLAEAIGQKETALSHPLAMLTDAGWIERRGDPLHKARSSFTITEPIIRAYQVLVEPNQTRISRGMGEAVWHDATQPVASLIRGPHLETLAIEWLWTHASTTTRGGQPTTINPAIFREGGRTYQLDVIATQPRVDNTNEVILVGETKARNTPMGATELHRLDNIIDRLGPRAATNPKRLLVSRSGFTSELKRLARGRPNIELADLNRLYTNN